jgi:transcriptional regulator with XRE-family HTH domain
MTSLRASISPNRRAALRFIAHARRFLLQALEEEKANGVTQSSIANTIGVHRSVISRELKGYSDIGLARVGEISHAMGRTPVLCWKESNGGIGHNSQVKSRNIENRPASTAPQENINEQMLTKSAAPVLEDA